MAVLTAGPVLTGAQLGEDGAAVLELLKESMLATLSQSSWRTSMKSFVEEVIEGDFEVVVDEGVEISQIVSARPDVPGEFDSYTKFVENGTANGDPFKVTIEITNVGVSTETVDKVYDDWIRFSAVSPPDFLDAFEAPIGEWVRIGSLDPDVKPIFGLAALLNNPNYMFNVSKFDLFNFEVAEEREPDTVNGEDTRVVFVRGVVNKGFLPAGLNLTALQAVVDQDPPTVREEATFWISSDSLLIVKTYGNVLVDATNATLRGNTTSLVFDYNEPLMVPDSMTELDDTVIDSADSG